MKFYKRFPGDINIKTGHLTLMQFGCYSRLLDYSYATDGPLPPDGDRCCQIAGAKTREERTAVAKVLCEFFIWQENEGWHRKEDPDAAPQESNRWRRCLDVTQAAWARIRLRVFERDGGRCRYCGETPNRPDCDHITPLESGGRTTMENLATACPGCNRSKGAKTIAEWRP